LMAMTKCECVNEVKIAVTPFTNQSNLPSFALENIKIAVLT
jgi:TolB-like protein